LPGTGWLTAIVTGMIALEQIKRKQYPTGSGLAQLDIMVGGIGCELISGFEFSLLPGRVHAHLPGTPCFANANLWAFPSLRI